MPKSKPPETDCPLLDQCKKAFGIDCKGRNWTRCDFYHALRREKLLEKRKQQAASEKEDRWREKIIADFRGDEEKDV